MKKISKEDVKTFENWGEYKGSEHFATFKNLKEAREYQIKLEKVFPKYKFTIKER